MAKKEKQARFFGEKLAMEEINAYFCG